VKKDMYRDIMAEHVAALTPLHTPSHPREDVWTELARQAGEHTDWFSREAFRIAGLLVRPDKSCTVPIGLDLETAGKITEEEVQFAALDFTIVCDQCGVWRGATQRSLKAHQALQCPRGLHEEGREYEVDCIVDEAETTKGTFLRVRWKGFDEESWEPQWELMGSDVREGSAREAAAEFWEQKVQLDWVAPPKGGNCLPLCPGGEHQCGYCCWWTRTKRGVERHEASCDHKPKQRGTASVSARTLRTQRIRRTTGRLPTVACAKRVGGDWEPAQLQTVASAMSARVEHGGSGAGAQTRCCVSRAYTGPDGMQPTDPIKVTLLHSNLHTNAQLVYALDLLYARTGTDTAVSGYRLL
jgi:hypothetical protein